MYIDNSTLTTKLAKREKKRHTQGPACDIGAYEFPYPVLTINKLALPLPPIARHGIITYTLTDTLLLGVTFARFASPTDGQTYGNSIVSWNGEISAGQTIILIFIVTHTGSYGEIITNTVQYKHPTGGGASSAVFSVLRPPQLSLAPVQLDFGIMVTY